MTHLALINPLLFSPGDRLSRQDGLTAGDFRKAFVATNRDWKAEQVGILLSRNGWLKELRLCYGRNFMPIACDRRGFGPADAAAIKIWRGL